MTVKVVSAVWCHACLLMKKRIKEFKQSHDIQFEYIDLDFDTEQLVGLEIGKVLPVYFVYNNGQLTNRFVGEKTIEELEKELYNAI